MAVPTSGALNMLNMAREALNGTWGSGTITYPISLYDLVKEENETLKKELEGLKLSTVENTEVKETENTEVELSTEEEPKPIVHNPENKERVNLGRKISPNRQRTIMDSVYDRIANKNN